MSSINNYWSKWTPQFLNQHLHCELVYIFGTPYITSPANIYIRHLSLWGFTITPKYHPVYLMKIETRNPFPIFLFHIIPVHSMEIREEHIFQRAIFIFRYAISLFSHRHWSKIFCHWQHNSSYCSNSMIENYTLKMIFINYICFSIGDMSWILQPTIRYYHTNDHF